MFDEDMSQYTRVEDFGDDAVWNTTVHVYGIFDRGFIDAFGQVDASQPVFQCGADFMPGVKQGDTLRVRGVNYTVGGVEPDDGTGWVVLKLNVV